MKEKEDCGCSSVSITDDLSKIQVTDCQIAIGYVVFDAICLILGAAGLRATVKGETIEEMAKLSIKATTSLERQIEMIAHESATATQRARAVFNILSTLQAGGMLGAIFGAFVKSLKWWQMALYATTGLATILAALATDGVALVAEIALLLVTFTWLVTDSIHAVNTCSLSTKQPPAEPNPVNPFQNPLPYLPQGAVMTANGSFLSFIGNQNDDSVASFSTNRTKVGSWEKFTIEPVDQDNHLFAIKTHSGNYVTAVGGGGQSGASGTNWAVRSDATSIGPSEALVMQMNEDGTYSFMTPQGYYVTAVNKGGVNKKGDPMRTNATKIGPAEIFSMQSLQNDGSAAERYRVTDQSTTIQDPSFESPALADGKYEYNPTSSPWNFDSHSGITSNNSGFTHKNPPAPKGNQVAFLQRTGSMNQTITVKPGSYVISFYAAQRANFPTNSFKVSIDGEDVYTCNPKSTNYEKYSTPSFQLTGGNHKLKFKGLDPHDTDSTCFVDMIVASQA